MLRILGGDDAAAGKQRHQHGVGPREEPEHQPDLGPFPRAVLPKQAADDGGGELGGDGERHQTDLGQRAGLAGDAIEGVTEKEHGEDADAADGEQQSGKVAALVEP